MSVSEQDIEIVEEWLDGELTPQQVEALRSRLSAEPQLAEAADRLRSDKQLRCQLFQAFEPSQAEIERLVGAVRRDVRKEELWGSRLRTLSRVSGIAASIGAVFFVGWISRSRLQVVGDKVDSVAMTSQSNHPQNPGNLQTMARNTNPTFIIFPSPVNVPNINAADRNGSLVNFNAGRPIDLSNISKNVPNYKVQVVDPITGQIKYATEFDQLDDAKQFADYVAHFRSAPDVTRDPTALPNIVPVNDEHVGH